jgi:ATP synthase protein I
VTDAGGIPLAKNSREERYRSVRQVGLLGTIPMVMVLYPLAGFFLGDFLDGKLGTEPLLSIILIVASLVAAVRDVIRIIRKANAIAASDSNKNGPAG